MAILTAHMTRVAWIVALFLGLLFMYGSMRVGMINPFHRSHRGDGKDA